MSIPIPLPPATYLLYGHLILTLASFIYKITLSKASLKLGPITVFFLLTYWTGYSKESEKLENHYLFHLQWNLGI